MKTRSICALEHEARGLRDGSVTTLIRPVKWPIRSFSDGAKRRIFCELDAGEINTLLDEPHGHPCAQIDSPFGPPGTRLAVREAHTFYPIELNPDPCDVWYRADGDTRKPPVKCTGVYRWRSPATMPAWAVRTHVTVESVRVVRCTDLSGIEAAAWGVNCNVAMQGVWLERFGKRHPFASSWAWVVGVER